MKISLKKRKKIKINFKTAEKILSNLYKPKTSLLDYNGKEREKLIFLKAYLTNFLHTGRACLSAQISRQTLSNWLRKDESFKKAYNSVEEAITEELESQGIKRAVISSDDLTKFFLKARKKEKYGEISDSSISGAFTLRDFYAVESKRQKTNSERDSEKDS